MRELERRLTRAKVSVRALDKDWITSCMRSALRSRHTCEPCQPECSSQAWLIEKSRPSQGKQHKAVCEQVQARNAPAHVYLRAPVGGMRG